jgi:hypothetical protein
MKQCRQSSGSRWTNRERSRPLHLLVASGEGEVFEHPTLQILPVRDAERLPVELGHPDPFSVSPTGTRLVVLHGCRPIGWDPAGQCRVRVEEVERNGRPQQVWAVGAVLPPGWLCLRLATTEHDPNSQASSPLTCCEVGGSEGEVHVAASSLRPLSHPDAPAYDTPDLPARVQRRLAASPGNRVLRRLAHCALEYSCRMAQNFFYRRGEVFLWVAGGCEAGCRGCVGLCRPRDGVSTRERLHATARVEDLVELAAEHVRDVPHGTVTFGLGAVDDPHLAYKRIERAILVLRTRTTAGGLNLDVQGGSPSFIGQLFTTGLGSVRIGLNSAVRERYERCYGGVGATFEKLRSCLGVARGKGARVFLGLEVLPGLSDRPSEIEALLRLIEEFRLDGVQLRTPAGRPDEGAGFPDAVEPALGIGELLRQLRRSAPLLWLGTGDLPARVEAAAAGHPSRRGPSHRRNRSP